jgi:large subunit ribosomal protein L15
MKLNELRDNAGATKNRMRVGRGIGSGKGKTAGRGVKGQKSRTGVSIKGFEGGQMPLHRRLPKRGFTNIFRREYAIVNVDSLNRFPAGTRVSPDELVASGLVRNLRDGIKILGEGELKVKLTVAAHAFSASARAKIEGAGGSVEQLSSTRREARPS